MCRTSGRTPRPSAYATISRKSVELGGDGGVPGLVGAGEVRPEPGDPEQPLGLGAQRLRDQLGPVSPGWQPLRPSPVSALSCTRAGRPAPAGRLGDLAQRPHPADRHVEVGLDRLPPGPAGRPQPAHDPAPAARRRAARAPPPGWRCPARCAPASTAARAHGTAPCPYASDFTTAMTAAPGARARSARTLARSAARSISARARRAVLSRVIAPSVSEGSDSRGLTSRACGPTHRRGRPCRARPTGLRASAMRRLTQPMRADGV